MLTIGSILSTGALVNRISGPNDTEIAHGSAAGGFQVYLSGRCGSVNSCVRQKLPKRRLCDGLTTQT